MYDVQGFAETELYRTPVSVLECLREKEILSCVHENRAREEKKGTKDVKQS